MYSLIKIRLLKSSFQFKKGHNRRKTNKWYVSHCDEILLFPVVNMMKDA